MVRRPGSWDSWTPGPWLSEFECIIIFFLIISSEGKGELTYEYIFNLSKAKSNLFAISLENNLLSTLLQLYAFIYYYWFHFTGEELKLERLSTVTCGSLLGWGQA